MRTRKHMMWGCFALAWEGVGLAARRSCSGRCRSLRKRVLAGRLRPATFRKVSPHRSASLETEGFQTERNCAARVGVRRSCLPRTGVGGSIEEVPRTIPCERRPKGKGQTLGLCPKPHQGPSAPGPRYGPRRGPFLWASGGGSVKRKLVNFLPPPFISRQNVVE